MSEQQSPSLKHSKRAPGLANSADVIRDGLLPDGATVSCMSNREGSNDREGAGEPLPSGVELLLAGRSADLGGGLTVLRALPQARRRMVGPFVFLDQMGPAEFSPGGGAVGMEVRPHPHIGLSTVTYLFEGEGVHRDSLGTVQPLRPGEVNWMTAGRGIAHSERSPEEVATRGGRLFGIQIWVAMPKALEEMAPTFDHHDADEIPEREDGGVKMRLVLGAFEELRSPVRVHSPQFYAVVSMEDGAVVRVPRDHDERAVYVVEGAVSPGQGKVNRGELAVLARGGEVLLRASGPSRILLFGGEPLDGPRHIYWNFVSSSKERIEQAKEDWRAQRFGAVPEETEFIPLPGDPEPPEPVNYP